MKLWFYVFRFPWLLKLLQQLYTMGFRLVSHEVNAAVILKTFTFFKRIISIWVELNSMHHTLICFQIGKANEGYYSLLEVVFMRDTVWNFLDDNNVLL